MIFLYVWHFEKKNCHPWPCLFDLGLFVWQSAVAFESRRAGAILWLSHVISLRYQLLSLTTKAKNLSLNSDPLFPGASWFSFGGFGVSPHDCGRVPSIPVKTISTEEEVQRLSSFRQYEWRRSAWVRRKLKACLYPSSLCGVVQSIEDVDQSPCSHREGQVGTYSKGNLTDEVVQNVCVKLLWFCATLGVIFCWDQSERKSTITAPALLFEGKGGTQMSVPSTSLNGKRFESFSTKPYRNCSQIRK